MIRIYHNPRCRKSREGLQLLEASGQEFDIVFYLKNPFSKEELTAVISKLGISPLELVRRNETIWKDHFRGKDLNDNQIIDAMVRYPKLVERPIVTKGSKAVIGRPSEHIIELLSN